MTLKQRQIKAVEETLEQVLKRYKRGYNYHLFDDTKCPLCLAFEGSMNCRELYECPIFLLGVKCDTLIGMEGYDIRKIPLPVIAGFLKSLLIKLEG